MNGRKIMTKASILLMLLLLGACSSETPFQPALDKQGSDVVEVTGTPTVPYHDDSLTTFSFIPPFPDPPAQPFSNFIIRGSGTTSHMGKSQMYEVSQLNVMTGIQTGTGVTTGARGVELWYEYEGSGSDPDANGDLSFSGSITITGGTGIFEGASGEGTYHGTANVVSNTGHRFVDADLTLLLGGRSQMNNGH